MSQDEMMELQQAIQDQGYQWEAAETSLSTMPAEEQDRRLGLRLPPEEMERLEAAMTELAPAVADFPDGWDWRDVGGEDWTTGIRDQQSCGSCVAFGTVAVLEAMVKRHRNDATLQPDLSEAHLFFCGCGNCCNRGWWPRYALDYAQEKGVPDEACFPYQPRDMACTNSCEDWQDRATKVVTSQEILDVGARKEFLATTGPMVGCMAVYRDFFNYRSGVYRHTSGDLAGYHAICVVGYSEAEEAWICKNSWGAGWGDSGYFKIGYGECEIDTRFPMYGVDDVKPPEPGPDPDPDPDPDDGCNFISRLVKSVFG
jgi:C1A family cysteine protease